MNRKGRVLVVDDSEDWRNVISDTLQRGGLYVDAVASIAAARERLEADFYHLIVLDIRLEDANPNNEEGFQLLHFLNEHSLAEAMQVIMLSAYPTEERVRTAFRQYKVTDFIFKPKDDFDNLDFLKQIQQVFTKDFQINLDLEVHWQGVDGPSSVILDIKMDNARIKRDTPQQTRITAELDDLLCRLFNKANSLLARPLTPGRSGAGVLAAQPFFESGGGQTVVVKFGEFHLIAREHNRFQEFVRPFVGGGRSTTILDVRRTAKLGGIVYSLLGAASDQLIDLGTFYTHSQVTDITSMLDRLFMQTCGAWYANPGRLKPCNLSVDYQGLLEFDFAPEKLEAMLTERLKSVQGKHKLRFTTLNTDRTFTNPILTLANKQLVRPTYMCPTHGDFNEHNILIDGTGHSWLIDFLRTGPGHILRDVAQLDTVIRLQLLKPTDATLEERLTMEEALCNINRFSQIEQLQAAFKTDNPALVKAYSTVVHLRTLARRIVSQNPSDDLSEYSIALLYYALNMLRFYSMPPVQREHALLSASLLADRLGL